MALKEFYQDIQDWVDQGCPTYNYYAFSTGVGLCTNLLGWSYKKELNSGLLQKQLEAEFIQAKLPPNYPFNWGDGDDYTKEVIYRSMYNNSRRLQWIKEHAQ